MTPNCCHLYCFFLWLLAKQDTMPKSSDGQTAMLSFYPLQLRRLCSRHRARKLQTKVRHQVSLAPIPGGKVWILDMGRAGSQEKFDSPKAGRNEVILTFTCPGTRKSLHR